MVSMLSFDGQVAVVTGAGRGLGRSYALELARRGAAVVVNDVATDEDGGPVAASAVAEICAAGGKATVSADDIASAGGGAAVVGRAMEEFGRIDVLIHNAGVLRPAMFGDLAAEQVAQVLDVHLVAAFELLRAAWPRFVAQGYGRVVLTSSSSTFGHPGNSNYAAAKAGLLGLTTTLAIEGADHDIKVNALLPSAPSLMGVDNPLIGPDTAQVYESLGRFGTRRSIESVTPMAVYLASRACGVTGAAYSALAGRYARVFTGVTSGWTSDDPEPSAEDVLAHIEQIDDRSTYTVPASMLDEIRSVS
jgi:NAD(P)-dependent dehydrogenase (short-subunit alcohol dehydrogenase family)